MEPRTLLEQLEARDLTVLAVTRQRPNQLLVYLHGSAGQYSHGEARKVIESVPGVVSAIESARTPTIVIVTTAPERPP